MQQPRYSLDRQKALRLSCVCLCLFSAVSIGICSLSWDMNAAASRWELYPWNLEGWYWMCWWMSLFRCNINSPVPPVMNMLVPSKKFWIGVLWTTSILSSIRPFRDSSIFDWNIFVVCFVPACKISMEFQIGALFKWRFFSSDDFLKERRGHRKGVLNAITKSSIELEVKQNKKKMRIMKFWSFFFTLLGRIIVLCRWFHREEKKS